MAPIETLSSKKTLPIIYDSLIEGLKSFFFDETKYKKPFLKMKIEEFSGIQCYKKLQKRSKQKKDTKTRQDLSGFFS